MIAKLAGTLDSTGADAAIIDVGGVGYLVYCSARTLGRLPPPGSAASLLIETHVREDHIHLYGFPDAVDREAFRVLTTVQGVGAKVALALQSAFSSEELVRAIAAQDAAMLTRANGVGQKLANRILVELKGKLGAIAVEPASLGAPAGVEATGPVADAVSALVNLGYRRAEALGAVGHAARRLGPAAPIDALIRAGLKELSG